MTARTEELEFTLYEFHLPLREALRTSHGLTTQRRGLLLRLADGNGYVGWGQSMPLPHRPSRVLSQELTTWQDKALQDPAGISHWPHSAAVASTAWSDLQARRAELPLYRWLLRSQLPAKNQLSPHSQLPAHNQAADEGAFTEQVALPLSALMPTGSPESVAQAGKLAVSKGYRAVKLKVGSDDFRADLLRIESLRQAVGPSLKLRLDANQAWDFSTAEANLAQLEPFDIDYVEEPTGGLAALTELAAASPVNIAIDESIQNLADLNQVLTPAINKKTPVLVIKPTLLGDLAQLWQTLSKIGNLSKLRVVITSALDSSLGIATAAHFATALALAAKQQPSQMDPCGLSTAGLLAADLCASPLEISQGQLLLPKGPGLGLVPCDQAINNCATKVAQGWWQAETLSA